MKSRIQSGRSPLDYVFELSANERSGLLLFKNRFISRHEV